MCSVPTEYRACENLPARIHRDGAYRSYLARRMRRVFDFVGETPIANRAMPKWRTDSYAADGQSMMSAMSTRELKRVLM